MVFPERRIVSATDRTLKTYLEAAELLGTKGKDWDWEWRDGSRAAFYFASAEGAQRWENASLLLR
jgi:hypothetical protein